MTNREREGDWVKRMAELEDGQCVSVGGLVTRIGREISEEQLHSTIRQLREALEKYGRHDEACGRAHYTGGMVSCRCGFDDVCRELGITERKEDQDG